MTRTGGHSAGRPGWSALSRADLARAGQVLGRLDELAGRQRLAIAHLASAELMALGGEQAALEAELRSILEAAGQNGAGAEPASPAERAAFATLSARVRRACQHNLALLSHARRSVSLLLGIDEDRAAYDRRARRLTTPNPARSRAL